MSLISAATAMRGAIKLAATTKTNTIDLTKTSSVRNVPINLFSEGLLVKREDF
jgi:hypothetical protein